MTNYYKDQFKRLLPITKYPVTVQFTSESGKTNFLSLIKAEFEQVSELIIKLKKQE